MAFGQKYGTMYRKQQTATVRPLNGELEMTNDEFKAQIVASIETWKIGIPHDKAVMLVDTLVCDLSVIRETNLTPDQVAWLVLTQLLDLS